MTRIDYKKLILCMDKPHWLVFFDSFCLNFKKFGMSSQIAAYPHNGQTSYTKMYLSRKAKNKTFILAKNVPCGTQHRHTHNDVLYHILQ